MVLRGLTNRFYPPPPTREAAGITRGARQVAADTSCWTEPHSSRLGRGCGYVNWIRPAGVGVEAKRHGKEPSQGMRAVVVVVFCPNNGRDYVPGPQFGQWATPLTAAVAASQSVISRRLRDDCRRASQTGARRVEPLVSWLPPLLSVPPPVITRLRFAS